MNIKQRVILVNRIIFFLSLLGIITAIYVLQSFLRDAPVICLTGGGCEAVRKHAVSYPFGIPVPFFGLIGYLGLAILSFLRTLNSGNKKLLLIMLGIAIFGVGFVTWFTAMELFVIKGTCTWCLISAVNMIVILFLIITSLKLEKSHENNL